jgi:type I restriction enzyme R subunit
LRYYQEIAMSRVLAQIAAGEKRILLTLGTGTGKTSIAFQITWKLFQAKWNIGGKLTRQPRILFLADRNNLADQAMRDFGSFNAFSDDAMLRIEPDEIRKKGKVPKNGHIFFTIFQTFMTGKGKDGNPAPYFGAYPADFFDFIVIDECHRGGANDESNWRGILEYFSPAVQLGLAATPKRSVGQYNNADTYAYFGEPVFIYSLKDGINDGFLTPFRVKQISTPLDDYVYTPDDTLVEGEIEAGKRYEEPDFNRIIEIKEREKKRVEILMGLMDQREKTLVFCATQDHALAIRDLINQMKSSTEPNYCVRVTANDGKLGDQFLRDFQDNLRGYKPLFQRIDFPSRPSGFAWDCFFHSDRRRALGRRRKPAGSVVGLGHQLDYLEVNVEEPQNLPQDAGAHEAGEAGRLGRIVGLLVRFFVDEFVGHWVAPGKRDSKRHGLL